MKSRILVALLVAGIFLPWAAGSEGKETAGPTAPIGWLDLHAGPRKFSVSEEDLQKATRSLRQGALLPVFKTKEKHGAKFAQVGALNLETGSAELGWVEIKLGGDETPGILSAWIANCCACSAPPTSTISPPSIRISTDSWCGKRRDLPLCSATWSRRHCRWRNSSVFTPQEGKFSTRRRH